MNKPFVIPMPQKVKISYRKHNSCIYQNYEIVPIELTPTGVTAYAYKHGVRNFRFDRIKNVDLPR